MFDYERICRDLSDFSDIDSAYFDTITERLREIDPDAQCLDDFDYDVFLAICDEVIGTI